MTITGYINGLSSALSTAVDLDAEQRHDEAAVILEQALDDDPTAVGDESEEQLLRVANLAQRVGMEADRQKRRSAKKAEYLTF